MAAQPQVCPWCGTVYQEYRPNCMNCGGALPHRDLRSAGDPPPPPPRQLPAEFVRRARSASRFELIFGSIFGGIGVLLGLVFIPIGIASAIPVFLILGPIFLLVFGGIGFGALYWGRRRSSRLITVLAEGLAAPGTIEDIDVDVSVQVNGRSPWKVQYAFEVNGVRFAGAQQMWNRDPELAPGTRVHVVYMPQAPGINSVYPPLG
jgi:hypothetical protein